MNKIVLDTNVVISATRSPNGNPADIMGMVLDGDLQLYYSTEILKEYERVLAYEKLNIDKEIQREVIEDITEIGESVVPVDSKVDFSNDPSDKVFYDTARTCGAVLVTGNVKHFNHVPHPDCVMTPAEFMQHQRIWD